MIDRYKHEYINCEISEIIDTYENESLPAEELTDRLNKYYNLLKPIIEICEKYNIPIKDLPEVLEEYIAYDNEEYLEKIKNQ